MRGRKWTIRNAIGVRGRNHRQSPQRTTMIGLRRGRNSPQLDRKQLELLRTIRLQLQPDSRSILLSHLKMRRITVIRSRRRLNSYRNFWSKNGEKRANQWAKRTKSEVAVQVGTSAIATIITSKGQFKGKALKSRGWTKACSGWKRKTTTNVSRK